MQSVPVHDDGSEDGVELSDVLPILPNARSLVMIEQVAGLMYVALVISRIVGLTLFRERARA